VNLQAFQDLENADLTEKAEYFRKYIADLTEKEGIPLDRKSDKCLSEI
jgi:hypothetical protein